MAVLSRPQQPAKNAFDKAPQALQPEAISEKRARELARAFLIARLNVEKVKTSELNEDAQKRLIRKLSFEDFLKQEGARVLAPYLFENNTASLRSDIEAVRRTLELSFDHAKLELLKNPPTKKKEVPNESTKTQTNPNNNFTQQNFGTFGTYGTRSENPYSVKTVWDEPNVSAGFTKNEPQPTSAASQTASQEDAQSETGGTPSKPEDSMESGAVAEPKQDSKVQTGEESPGLITDSIVLEDSPFGRANFGGKGQTWNGSTPDDPGLSDDNARQDVEGDLKQPTSPELKNVDSEILKQKYEPRLADFLNGNRLTDDISSALYSIKNNSFLNLSRDDRLRIVKFAKLLKEIKSDPLLKGLRLHDLNSDLTDETEIEILKLLAFTLIKLGFDKKTLDRVTNIGNLIDKIVENLKNKISFSGEVIDMPKVGDINNVKPEDDKPNTDEAGDTAGGDVSTGERLGSDLNTLNNPQTQETIYRTPNRSSPTPQFSDQSSGRFAEEVINFSDTRWRDHLTSLKIFNENDFNDTPRPRYLSIDQYNNLKSLKNTLPKDLLNTKSVQLTLEASELQLFFTRLYYFCEHPPTSPTLGELIDQVIIENTPLAGETPDFIVLRNEVNPEQTSPSQTSSIPTTDFAPTVPFPRNESENNTMDADYVRAQSSQKLEEETRKSLIFERLLLSGGLNKLMENEFKKIKFKLSKNAFGKETLRLVSNPQIPLTLLIELSSEFGAETDSAGGPLILSTFINYLTKTKKGADGRSIYPYDGETLTKFLNRVYGLKRKSWLSKAAGLLKGN